MLLNYGVGEDSWESLGLKEIQLVHPKEDQSWVFIGRTNAEAETLILWPSHVKSWLIGKDPDAGSDWGQEEKGTTEDEMAGWHHGLDGRDSEWTPGSWWWTGRPGVLWFMGSQRIRHNWATELNWTELNWRDIPPCMKCLQVPEILQGMIHYLFQALFIFTGLLHSRYFWEGEDRKLVELSYE